jgi:YD repeat-containing protein
MRRLIFIGIMALVLSGIYSLCYAALDDYGGERSETGYTNRYSRRALSYSATPSLTPQEKKIPNNMKAMDDPTFGGVVIGNGGRIEGSNAGGSGGNSQATLGIFGMRSNIQRNNPPTLGKPPLPEDFGLPGYGGGRHSGAWSGHSLWWIPGIGEPWWMAPPSGSSGHQNSNYGQPAEGHSPLTGNKPLSFSTKSAPIEIEGKYANVDMLLGSLFFSTTDFYLKDRGDLEIEISRVYTSHVRAVGESDAGQTQTPQVGLGIRPWYFGPGWWWYMGRIDHYDSLIYYGNGACEKLFQDIATTSLKNGNFEIVKFGAAADTLFKQNGTRFIYGFDYDGTYGNFKGKYVSKIIDAHGNYIDIHYHGSVPLIDSITNNLGKRVWFGYSDMTDLYSTRLLKLYYKNSDDSTQFIKYVYDDSLGNLYPHGGSYINPLVMVVYPNSDTFQYAYSDSAKYGGSNYYCEAYRISKMTLPTGGTINYDWEFFREHRFSEGLDPYINKNYWHVGVTAIRFTYPDNSADTIDFDFNYEYEDYDYYYYPMIYSRIVFPDNSGRAYFHSHIAPHDIDSRYQDSGLLDRILFFTEYPAPPALPETCDYVYSFESCDPNAECFPGYMMWDIYESHAIGRIPGTTDTIRSPFLTKYSETYGHDYKHVITHSNSSFDSTTGDFKIKTTDKDTTKTYWIHYTSNNTTIIDHILEISHSTGIIDTIRADNYWHYGGTQIDSTKITTKGVTHCTKYTHDSYGNITRIIEPPGDTLNLAYGSTSNYIYPCSTYTSYFCKYKADYFTNTGKLKSIINANGDTTFYYYDDADRLFRIKAPMENNYSLIRRYSYSPRTQLDSIRLDSTLYKVTTSYFDAFNRKYKTKTLDSDNDSIITRVEYDILDRVTK